MRTALVGRESMIGRNSVCQGKLKDRHQDLEDFSKSEEKAREMYMVRIPMLSGLFAYGMG